MHHPLILLLFAVLLSSACGGAHLVRGELPGTGGAAADGTVIATVSPPPAAAEPAAAAPPATGQASRPSPAAPPPTVPLHPFLPANGRPRVVALDPGHGGPEVGAAGAGVAEKDVNLRIALKLKALLERDGMIVVLTRDEDRRAVPPPGFEPPPDWRDTRTDLQARIDIANLAGADVFISIHNNGSSNPNERGTEVWWDGRRPFAAYNRALAELVLEELLHHIRAAGYPTVNRGLKEDSSFRIWQGRAFPIFVLGPPRTGAVTTRATNMPAVLGESLFLSNPSEAVQLTREEMLDAIARGYHAALTRYFHLIDDGTLALPPEGLPPETPNHYDLPGPTPR
jgi:N-acetylmuramoyl-L-alanine amidase